MFVVGQRWISEAETDLGLGLVQSVDFRMVSVYFPVTDETRTYATENAPLTRIRFAEGDMVPLQDGTMVTVEGVEEIDDILFYEVEGRLLPETMLAAAIQLNAPADRLFTGQIDNNNLFELRQMSLDRIASLRQRPYYGLLGARTNLLPHQLHIAEQTTQDALPRVLLADEVGLGKTIEAGLILHRLIRLQRVSRVLVLVPDHLVHQWLVEMVRRFNLHFQVITEADLDSDENAFAQGQMFISPLSLALSDKLAADALEEDWDVLVVDEAHHLGWSQEEGGDTAYRMVEQMAQLIPSVLLLTATPEQLGVEAHYARLRLLDPARYPSLEAFITEQASYRPIADIAAAIAADEPLTTDQIDTLKASLSNDELADKGTTLTALIDRFGPGRALYRNTRQGVSGFPQRQPHIVELPLPEAYATAADPLHPHHGEVEWADEDPRAAWLADFLTQNKQEKCVLITHSVSTVLELERFLWERHGIPAAVFHERMDMVERDRAAAYFADQEQGARLLICSEIGSEGRNFQFASELVLFDLPFNCDLIEQRIGRLDRIGQKRDINIHIPVFADHATAQWAGVLDSVLDAFSHPNPTAQPLLLKYEQDIRQWLEQGATPNELAEAIRAEQAEMKAAFEAGRDRLLELHSCPPKAREHARDMSITHIEDEGELNDFVELFADAFGLEVNDLDSDCILIAPGDHMLVPDLPHLPEDGFMATTNRDVALSRDDVQFLSWEHPFIDQALELITSGPAGNAAVGYIENHEYKTGDCLIQLQFTARCPAPRALQIERFLPTNAMHLTMTPRGDLKVNEPELDEFVLPLKRGTARGLVEQKEAQVRPLISKLEKMGMGQLDKMIERAQNKATAAYEARKQRLTSLAKTNPSISESVIAGVELEGERVNEALSRAQLTLDSVRLVFCG